eukprot:scaffold7641_cov115-Cylindrotheca_fusiformis.AAC.34
MMRALFSKPSLSTNSTYLRKRCTGHCEKFEIGAARPSVRTSVGSWWRLMENDQDVYLLSRGLTHVGKMKALLACLQRHGDLSEPSPNL